MNSSFRCIVATVAFTASIAAVSGCGGSSDTPDQTRSSKSGNDRSGTSLETAIGKAVDAGKGYSIRDATDLDRDANRSTPNWWKVCFQRKGEAPSSIDFGVVLKSETCPDKWGGHVTAPKTPNLVGKSFKDAEERILSMGYPISDLRVFYGGNTVVEINELNRVQGQVCTQSPQAGSPFVNPKYVKLYVAAEASCS